MKGSLCTTNSVLLNMPDVQSERPSQIVDVDVVSKSTEPQVNQGADERRSQDVYWVQKDLAGGMESRMQPGRDTSSAVVAFPQSAFKASY